MVTAPSGERFVQYVAASAVEAVAMNERAFTPAMGRFLPTRFYDPVAALMRERVWRGLVAMHVAPRTPGSLTCTRNHRRS